MLLGAHVSAAGGIDKAVDRIEALGGEAMQLFIQSPRRWQPTAHEPQSIERFKARRREAGVRYVLCHALYLINIATSNRPLYERSRKALIATIDVANQIDADVVFHVGSHGGVGVEPALGRIAHALEPAVERLSGGTHLLLENCAGGGGTVGRSIEELAAVIDRLRGQRRLGICLDTCHLWSSGIDITDSSVVDRLADDVARGVGRSRLRAVHVNDTSDPLGSNRDVHANLGRGRLKQKLGVLLGHPAFADLPAILETPGRDGRGPDAAEMRKLRRLATELGKVPKRPRKRS